MQHRILHHATISAAASLAVLPLIAGCSSDEPETSASTDATASSSASTASPDATDTASSPDAASTTTEASASTETESSDATDSAYRDGSYTVRGIYGGAPSYMTITIDLSDDVITDVDVEPMPENNDTSRGYQERFAAAVPDEVIGKSIDDLEVDVIAGASGCAVGFNDALTKIRDQARIS